MFTKFIKRSFQNSLLKQSSEIIGIDLGTTNSCIAIQLSNNQVQVIENSEGFRTTPSIVAFQKDGSHLIGMPAKRQQIVNPESTFFAIKRLMGKKFDDIDVQKDLESFPYKIIKSKNGDAWVQTKENKQYSPQQISAYILMKMKDTAENYLKTSIKNAIITVPAYYNDLQRQATKDAGEIAGLNVQRIINEPTAAALAYGANQSINQKKVVAVYDFGGGTFDISILQINESVFEVKATNGDTNCGGEDIDSLLQNLLLQKFKQEHGIDLKSNKMATQRIRESAEKAKIELSQKSQSEINLPYIYNQVHFSCIIKRNEFEKLIEDLVKKTMNCVQKCIKDSGFQIQNIDEVLLVGGSSRIPIVQKKITEFFQKNPNKSINPDEAVAIGAALQAGVLKGNVQDIILIDVTPLSLGKSIQGDIMSVIIPRNTTVPVSKSKIYTTVKDGQTQIDVIIYQGEREIASKNKEIGRFILDGIPMAPKGLPKIKVTFQIDQNGILHVKALELGTGKKQEIKIQNQGKLSKAEIDKMMQDAEKHKEQDILKQKISSLINKSEGLNYQIDKDLKIHQDRLQSTDINLILQQIDKLKDLISQVQYTDAYLLQLQEQYKITKDSGFLIGKTIYKDFQQQTSNNSKETKN
ncbi:hypothetical protein IMG5_075250 [Ichthyophthirius multifiliis]|uniref:Mitochondrial-type heat shock protein 70 n=1 Tax=Ichthyophthirius multifiliis TaxID=5932 RepID=G0QQ46_ICHMU|nr:hypothetical protein IMG5_075250 [Ichthyophthirius multifiliis]EGR32660.1 hypothetical protein IMG5_075250 [Ichthyophthirius multifiliis]|eukprot:XP_004036646.1 hypothetical protein IMG5_075250 [Ichthyophthirius multifiliis]